MHHGQRAGDRQLVSDRISESGAVGVEGRRVEAMWFASGAGTPTDNAGTLIGSVTVTNGVVPASANVTLTLAGSYEFWAVYSGDGVDLASTSLCGSETVNVGKNQPTAATTQSMIPNDTLTLTGATSTAGGTVDFYVFAPGVTCSEANVANAAFTQLGVALTGNTTASTSNTGSGPGMYTAIRRERPTPPTTSPTR